MPGRRAPLVVRPPATRGDPRGQPGDARRRAARRLAAPGRRPRLDRRTVLLGARPRARAAGCAVSLDLIFGWPGQSAEEWRADLDAALALGPDHLSCYPLELALEPEEAVANWPGGGWAVLERWRRRASAGQPDDAGVARLYATAERRLARAGYRHYEIANWARPGRASLHNLTYWRNGDWLGVGAGAHSHLQGARSRQPGGLLEYCERVEAGLGRIPDGAADEASDSAMLALRLDRGLHLGRYAGRFGAAVAADVGLALRSLDGRSLLRWTGERVRLTPRGRILASEVFVRLLPDRAPPPGEHRTIG